MYTNIKKTYRIIDHVNLIGRILLKIEHVEGERLKPCYIDLFVCVCGERSTKVYSETL